MRKVRAMTASRHFAARMQRIEPNAVGELLRQGADPSLISFGGGYPDGSLFPAAELGEIFAELVGRQGEASLQYTVAEGAPRLRRQVAARLAAQGTPCSYEDVLVLQGSQQGLDLVGKLVIDPGDAVITERPTFMGALIAFDPFQPRFRGVRLDAGGMDMEHLEQVLAEEPGTKLIYTIPDFQNPTGMSLVADRRRRLIELANRHDVLILEDTAYREVRFAGVAPPTLKSLDTEGRVILLGSFSKILAPGLRLGYAVAAPGIVEKLGLLKVAADTQTSTINMLAASLYLDRHDIDAHIATLRAAYRRKKELMLSLVRRHFPQEVTATDPEGGLFTWLSFPDGFDSAAFMRRVALPVARVAYVPGAAFFCESPETHHARVNYSGQSEERIEEGMRALAEVLKAEMRRG